MANPSSGSSNNINSEIIQEFASIMMEQCHNSRWGFEEHQNHQMRLFNQGPASHLKAVASCLQFQRKHCFHSESLTIPRKSPSLLQSEASEPEEELVDKMAPPLVEEPIAMETTN